MATFIKLNRKSGISYRVQFYVDHKRYSKTFPTADTKEKQKLIRKQAANFKKQIESEIENYKSGFIDHVPSMEGSKTGREKFTLKELTNELKDLRKSDVEPCTILRNVRAMNNLMICLGQNFVVNNLNDKFIEQFKNYRLSLGTTSEMELTKTW